MLNIYVVLPENGTIASVTDTIRFFTEANRMLKAKGNKDAFRMQTVCFVKNILLEDGKLSFNADCLLDDTGIGDMVIVPSITGDAITATQLNRHYISWLITQHKNGAEIAGFGTGNFLLAAAGLLNDASCSAHWVYADEFSSYFPEIKLASDTIITEKNGVYTCGRHCLLDFATPSTCKVCRQGAGLYCSQIFSARQRMDQPYCVYRFFRSEKTQ